jgi:hypothetical protein
MKTILFLALLAYLGTSLSLRGSEKDYALILEPGQNGDIGVENVPPAENTPPPAETIPPATGDPNAVAGGVAVTPQAAEGAAPQGAAGGGDGQGGYSEGAGGGAGGAAGDGAGAGAGAGAAVSEEIPPESKPEETTIPLPPEQVVQDAPEVTKSDLQNLEARVIKLEEGAANQAPVTTAPEPITPPSDQTPTPPVEEPQNGDENVVDEVAAKVESKVEQDLNLQPPAPTTVGGEQPPATFQATPHEIAAPLYGIASGGVNTSGKYKNFPTDKAKNTDPVAIAGAKAAAEQAEDAHKDFVENDLEHIQDIVNTVQDAFIQEPTKRFQ